MKNYHVPWQRPTFLTVLCGWLFATLALVQAAADNKPNVIVFLADDEGYGELGCQGNQEIPTPHIDSIARNGIRFTQGYVSGPYCSPTRAGLMTGRYQTRFGHEFNEGPIGGKFGLPLTEKTFADRMRALGYATCAIGKWHLGSGLEFRPAKRGFDEFYGTLANTPFFHPNDFVDSRVSPEVQNVEDPNFYTTDAYATRAVDWLERTKGRPFFLYLPFNAQHAPLQAPKKYLDRFPQIADAKRKLFAAMMSAKDDAIGQVLAKVRDLGQEENTLIFYLSDNGGRPRVNTSKNDPLRGQKSTTLEGGIRVPFLVQWKGRLPAGKTYFHPIIQLDLLPTVIAAAGAKVDPTWQLDGVNLLPYLSGRNTGRPHETLYWRFGEQWAVRHGDWKLVVSSVDGPGARLFNLADDLGEARDLAAKHPGKVKELAAAWRVWNAEQKDPLWTRPNYGRPVLPAVD
ncbi:MAG: sulfatase family protein [Opitutaceae bacterium]